MTAVKCVPSMYPPGQLTRGAHGEEALAPRLLVPLTRLLQSSVTVLKVQFVPCVFFYIVLTVPSNSSLRTKNSVVTVCPLFSAGSGISLIVLHVIPERIFNSEWRVLWPNETQNKKALSLLPND